MIGWKRVRFSFLWWESPPGDSLLFFNQDFVSLSYKRLLDRFLTLFVKSFSFDHQ